jgi:hypothetical protein
MSPTRVIPSAPSRVYCPRISGGRSTVVASSIVDHAQSTLRAKSGPLELLPRADSALRAAKLVMIVCVSLAAGLISCRQLTPEESAAISAYHESSASPGAKPAMTMQQMIAMGYVSKDAKPPSEWK